MIPECDTDSVLDLLESHHEFMESLNRIAVFCNNNGAEAARLADYRKDPESQKQTGDFDVHVFTETPIPNANKRKNITIHKTKCYDTGFDSNSFDFILAVDTLRFQVDPINTLKHWNSILKVNGMLCSNVLQTSYIDDLTRWQVFGYSKNYFSWNMLNLIQCLSVNGFDCRDGHFKQTKHNPWIWSAVYKNDIDPLDPETATWYDLKDKNLTPISLDETIQKYGYATYKDLVVEWLDHSVYDIATESLP